MWAIAFSVVMTFLFTALLIGWAWDKIGGGSFATKVFMYSLVAFLGYMAGQS